MQYKKFLILKAINPDSNAWIAGKGSGSKVWNAGIRKEILIALWPSATGGETQTETSGLTLTLWIATLVDCRLTASTMQLVPTAIASFPACCRNHTYRLTLINNTSVTSHPCITYSQQDWPVIVRECYSYCSPFRLLRKFWICPCCDVIVLARHE